MLKTIGVPSLGYHQRLLLSKGAHFLVKRLHVRCCMHAAIAQQPVASVLASPNIVGCVPRSTWVMLNTEKRRAVRIPDEMRVKLYAYTPQPLRCASAVLSTCYRTCYRTLPHLADVYNYAQAGYRRC